MLLPKAQNREQFSGHAGQNAWTQALTGTKKQAVPDFPDTACFRPTRHTIPFLQELPAGNRITIAGEIRSVAIGAIAGSNFKAELHIAQRHISKPAFSFYPVLNGQDIYRA